jgi:hypothetical protein
MGSRPRGKLHVLIDPILLQYPSPEMARCIRGPVYSLTHTKQRRGIRKATRSSLHYFLPDHFGDKLQTKNRTSTKCLQDDPQLGSGSGRSRCCRLGGNWLNNDLAIPYPPCPLHIDREVSSARFHCVNIDPIRMFLHTGQACWLLVLLEKGNGVFQLLMSQRPAYG